MYEKGSVLAGTAPTGCAGARLANGETRALEMMRAVLSEEERFGGTGARSLGPGRRERCAAGKGTLSAPASSSTNTGLRADTALSVRVGEARQLGRSVTPLGDGVDALEVRPCDDLARRGGGIVRDRPACR